MLGKAQLMKLARFCWSRLKRHIKRLLRVLSDLKDLGMQPFQKHTLSEQTKMIYTGLCAARKRKKSCG